MNVYRFTLLVKAITMQLTDTIEHDTVAAKDIIAAIERIKLHRETGWTRTGGEPPYLIVNCETIATDILIS